MDNTKLSDYRNPEEYAKVILDMFLVYARSEQFAGLSREERIHTVDCIEELNMIFIGEIKANQGEADNGPASPFKIEKG